MSRPRLLCRASVNMRPQHSRSSHLHAWLMTGSQDQLNFANGMQWLLFIACLLVIAVNVLAWVKLGRACASWEVVYVMGVVCESSPLPASGCRISVQGAHKIFQTLKHCGVIRALRWMGTSTCHMGNFNPPPFLIGAPPPFSISICRRILRLLHLEHLVITRNPLPQYRRCCLHTPIWAVAFLYTRECVLYTQLLQPPSTPIHSPINLSFLDYVTKVC